MVSQRKNYSTNFLKRSFDFSYDTGSRLVGITRPGSDTVLAFDNSNFLTSIVHSKSGVSVSSFQYERDSIGNRTKITSLAGITSYTYDHNSQLTGSTSTEAGNESFQYDGIGNRVSDQSGSYLFDPKKQLLAEDPRFTYQYDNNGNLIKRTSKSTGEITNFSYTSENQLKKFEVFSGATKTKEVIYLYDALGRRVEKIVNDLIDSTKSYTRRYAYDGENIHIEYDGTNRVLASYTHSPLAPDDVLAANVTTDGKNAGLAKTAGSYFYLKDAQGTITDITDSVGTKVQHYVYSAFGQIVGIKDGSGADISANPNVNTSFTYTGREFDQESGLYYYRARYYDANTGRFLQRDPKSGEIQMPISVNNGYSYAANNPISLTDPSGKFFELLIGAALLWGNDTQKAFATDIVVAAAAAAIIVASGGTGAGALAAVGSTAGGAAVASAAMASFQGGSFWQNFESDFHPIFRVSAAFLAGSAIAAPGGVQAATGNGIQGQIISGSGYQEGADTGLTLGSSATFNSGSGLATHEFGHTIQFIALAAFAGHQQRAGYTSSATGYLFKSYLILGASGQGLRELGVTDNWNPFEISASKVGGMFK